MTYPPAKGNRARTPTWLPGVNLPYLRRGPEDLPEVRAGQALFKTVKERGSTDLFKREGEELRSGDLGQLFSCFRIGWGLISAMFPLRQSLKLKGASPHTRRG
uniref:Uncharacterized protein n=1 Tax=Picea glauca TaxID=3330 RepID=A0A101LYL0_PICGL|nr:hypothetical protein ABT39_MTgene5779 [Picea glauca]QHR90448.1 hypothetical protein Q903MT_gene4472 [Picea sitchensis]